MNVFKKARVLIPLVLCALSGAMGHSQDEKAGYVLNIKTNVGTGYNCGRASTPLYCYGIPVNIGTAAGGNGNFWIDTYTAGSNAGTGFVAFNGVADLGQGTVVSNTPTLNSSGQIEKLVVNFKGTTNDGDNGTYTGTMTLNFTYYYSGGGGGRGGAGAGWRFICTGGTLAITYH